MLQMTSDKRCMYGPFRLTWGLYFPFHGLTTKSCHRLGIAMAHELVLWVLYERWFSPYGSYSERRVYVFITGEPASILIASLDLSSLTKVFFYVMCGECMTWLSLHCRSVEYASVGVLNITQVRWWMNFFEVDDTFDPINARCECYFLCF